MEKVNLQKTDIMTDFTPLLKKEKSERNQKGYDYNYLAKLSEYQSIKNIKREFENRITDLIIEGDHWSLLISTVFLNTLTPGEIVEIGVNLKQSRKYSGVSKSFFLVLENTANQILLATAPTAFQIFKTRAYWHKNAG